MHLRREAVRQVEFVESAAADMAASRHSDGTHLFYKREGRIGFYRV